MVPMMFSTMFDRWHGRGFSPADRAAWEVVLTEDDAAFYLTAPQQWQDVAKKQLSTTWPACGISPGADPFDALNADVCATSHYKRHHIFSLDVDQRKLDLLDSLLGTKSLLKDGDQVAVQVLMLPVSPDWWMDAAESYDRFRSGNPPKRVNLDKSTLGKAAVTALGYTALGAVNLLDEILTGEDGPRETLDTSDPISNARGPRYRVARKLKGDVVDVTVQVAIDCADPRRQSAILRSIRFALREYDGQNMLVLKKSPAGRTWPRMIKRQPPLKVLNSDYMAPREAAGLCCLPSAALTKKHGVTYFEQRQVKLPQSLRSGGLLLGSASYRGKDAPVYIPTSDYDELCKPRVCPGAMGTGKTTFGANLVVEAVKNGFSAVALDPQKGDIGKAAAAVLGEDKVTRIKLGEQPVALDWREADRGPGGANRVGNEVLSFFKVLAGTDDIGHQTARYLRAAAKAVPGGNLYDIIRMFDDHGFRQERLAALDGFDLRTWQQFDDESDKRQRQYMRPVMNRLDGILGDSYLAACMEADNGIDLVQYVNQPGHAIIFDLPGRSMARDTKNLLGALIATKLDMAMVLRDEQHPTVIVQDEPHQYNRGAEIWRSAAVESRQHRFAYCWLFHAWQQLDHDVREIIRAAGPHYHVFRSSLGTYKSLEEQMAPITLEEALELPRYHTINIMEAGGRPVTPFVCKMAPPPADRL